MPYSKWSREPRDLHINVATSPFRVFTHPISPPQTERLARSAECDGMVVQRTLVDHKLHAKKQDLLWKVNCFQRHRRNWQ